MACAGIVRESVMEASMAARPEHFPAAGVEILADCPACRAKLVVRAYHLDGVSPPALVECPTCHGGFAADLEQCYKPREIDEQPRMSQLESAARYWPHAFLAGSATYLIGREIWGRWPAW